MGREGSRVVGHHEISLQCNYGRHMISVKCGLLWGLVLQEMSSQQGCGVLPGTEGALETSLKSSEGHVAAVGGLLTSDQA